MSQMSGMMGQGMVMTPDMQKQMDQMMKMFPAAPAKK